MTTDPTRRVRVREVIGSAVQYALLFGFAAVAAAISAHGLVGFARTNMALPGVWPYLLWGALDGAAGLCAVLLVRRAARGESALAPRLAVWGLVTASSLFNWAHAPDHPGAREAFALMPVITAVLFEFSLRETRLTARRAQRRVTGLSWIRPTERIRVQMQLAIDTSLSAEQAAQRVRVQAAARRLHALRLMLTAREHAVKRRPITARLVLRAERRAQAALTRVGFADPAIAAEVLRHVQVLTLTPALARLDYATPADSHELLASLITTPGEVGRQPHGCSQSPANGHFQRPVNGTVQELPAAGNGMACRTARRPGPAAAPRGQSPGSGDHEVIAAATRIIAEAREKGEHLSQAMLARRLRREGHHIANERLRWLADISGMQPFPGRR